MKPLAQFAFYWDIKEINFRLPFYHIIGGDRDKSTVSIKTLKNLNIDVPLTPSFCEWDRQGRPMFIK